MAETRSPARQQTQSIPRIPAEMDAGTDSSPKQQTTGNTPKNPPTLKLLIDVPTQLPRPTAHAASACLHQLCPPNTVPDPAGAGGPGDELSRLLRLLGWAVGE